MGGAAWGRVCSHGVPPSAVACERLGAISVKGVYYTIYAIPRSRRAIMSSAAARIVEVVPQICDAVMARSKRLFKRYFAEVSPVAHAVKALSTGPEGLEAALPEWSQADRNQLRIAWEENREQVRFVAKFMTHNMPLGDSLVLARAMGVPDRQGADQALREFKENPWKHVGSRVQRRRDDKREPWLTFGELDRFGQMCGADPTSPARIVGCAVNFMSHALASCNTIMETELLSRGVATTLGIDAELVWQTLCEHTMVGGNDDSPLLTQRVGNKVMSGLADMVSAELTSARLLLELADAPLAKTFDVTEADVRGCSKLDLDPAQVEAVQMALSNKLSVLTGGPGTGKTTITSTVVAMADQLGLRTTLAATTGRAATKLSAACDNRPASTLHHTLEWRPGSAPKRNESNPLDDDLFVVDESSFLDATALANFLRALPKQGRVVLVGDIDQIPSVGPGRVLADLIEILPTTRLTKVFRQALDSPIVAGAHQMLAGNLPDIDAHPQAHYALIDPREAGPFQGRATSITSRQMTPREEDLAGLDLLMQRVEFLLQHNASPYWIQAIASRYDGPVGVNRINEEMRERFNAFSPTKREVKTRRDGKEYTLREGDKVIFKQNVKSGSDDSDAGKIWTGSMGLIKSIDPMGESLTVKLDTNETHTVPRSSFNAIMHGYCITTHASQGSEFAHVIMPLEATWEGQAQRYMVYTASTRAKKTMAFIGTPERLQRAIDTNDVAKRSTMLLPVYQSLREASPKPSPQSRPAGTTAMRMG